MGSLTVVKQTVPAGGAQAGFDAGPLGAFSLGDGGSRVFSELEAGPCTVMEAAAAGWELESVACSSPDGGEADYRVAGTGVTVNLAEGEHVACTFTNRTEQTDAPTVPGELPYTGSAPFLLPLLAAGLWVVLAGLGMMTWPFRKGGGG